jgi:phage terminase small subunit
VNYDEPSLPDATTIPPPPRSLTGAGRIEWVRLVKPLIENRVLTDADMTAFEDYCRALSELRRYELKAKRVGLEQAIAKGFQGTVIKLRAQLVQMRAHLGLSPATRGSVKAAPRSSSRLDRWFNRNVTTNRR